MMMKSICVLGRRADFSRDAFQRYYDEHHAPLAVKHFPFTRYVRNHLLDNLDIGFDTISEFWATDVEKLSALMTGPVGDILREDERRFMDQSKIAPGVSEEYAPCESASVIANDKGERYAVLLDWADEQCHDRQWARDIIEEEKQVSIDFVTSWQQPEFPAKAVLWTLERQRPASLPDSVTTTFLRVKRVETELTNCLNEIDRQT